MNDMPVFNVLDEIIDKDIVSFHVPGHKKGSIFEKVNYRKYKDKIGNMDTTEIPGTDNLHSPEGVIKKSQEIASNVFKSDYTFFLVNGSTCGIYASIMSVCNPKDKIIVNRDCHQSVVNSCILGDIEPIYVNPNIDLNLGISLGVSYEEIKKVIDNNKDAKAVLITSPTYYGVSLDVKKIADYVHSKGKILIVDEAHGAHLGLSDKLPKKSLELGADIVIQSTHKTLPSFTQSSMLHVKEKRVNIDKLKSFLKIVQSSSPSYILMSSLEMAVNIYINYGKELMNELIENINSVINFIDNLKNIKVFKYKHQDITKLYIITKELKKSGYEVENILRDKYNIQVELSNSYGILLVCSIGNTNNDFKKLKKALNEIDNEIGNENLIEINYPTNIPKKILNPRDAFYLDKKSIRIEESIGKICGEYIIPYPPGISILSPGEEITKEVIDYIKKSKEIGMNITGIKDTNLNYIQVID
ncbi:aminotransferase class I/II-fold pyridoxal phosphate-dependent enzyme [Tepidibacter formicigenes]|uniref:Arginine decarboxylase n=1 Tax=Tepidibacter formicigenes DSM 15518 TaxID=1123349 RepID=A0A1M6PPV4_9FIRM|nr:aminotransferase class I/II-fold pyridoxal phosphate-dependent enzyme [Tepidibacter formicigenes]SHK09942.1 arginine decarboxylase [Tepidibacter formicigenes DSM 15518]